MAPSLNSRQFDGMIHMYCSEAALFAKIRVAHVSISMVGIRFGSNGFEPQCYAALPTLRYRVRADAMLTALIVPPSIVRG